MGTEMGSGMPGTGAEKAPAYPSYQDYKCPRCGHKGNDSDPHIHHTSVGIICLKCGAKTCD